jgi:biopolymer transport protein ExbB
MPIILQGGTIPPVITDTVNKAAQAVTRTVAEKETLFSLLAKGGLIMIPLGILLLIAVFVFVQRFLYIKKVGKVEDNFMNLIRDQIISGNVSSAKNMAANHPSAIGRMIHKGVQRIGKPIDSIDKSMENVGKLELYKMERNLNALSIIASIAPMFGFLGTIIGMVQFFMKLNATNTFDTGIVAGGIYTKLITSAAGLIIGMLAYVGYNILQTQIDKTAHRMEGASADFIDVLQEPTR